jgi:hypothetical protein
MSMTKPTKFWTVIIVLLALGSVGQAHAATRSYDIGDRLTVQQLYATDGQEKVFSFENPSVVILWATWSSASLIALDEMLEGAPKGGIRWQIVPINVDAPALSSSDTIRVHAAARAAGWNGPVWHDRDYHLMDRLGVLSVPTVMFTALGGAIDEIEHDWSASLRDRLFVLYFGAFTDSFPGMVTSKVLPQCRSKAESARKLWRMEKKPSAIAIMQGVADSCAGLPSDMARLANWKWSVGDSIRHQAQIAGLVRSRETNAWTLTAQASLAARAREDSTAVGLCRDAIALDSSFFPAWALLTELSYRTADTTTARSAYDRARSLNHLDSRVLAFGSRLAESDGKIADAVRLVRAAVEARQRRAGM